MSSSTSHIDVRFPGGKRVDATVDGHLIRTDQSTEHGGSGSAPEPFDLFLASLATCAGLYVLIFCQARGIPTSELRLDQEQVFEDGKLRRILLRVLLPAGFPEKYIDAVRAAAAGCKVKKTLLAPPEVEVVAIPAHTAVRPGHGFAEGDDHAQQVAIELPRTLEARPRGGALEPGHRASDTGA